MKQLNSQENRRIVVDITMSVEDARKVIWVGRGPRASIGELLDSKQINTSDLAWAIDKAYSPQVRAAARTLLANWLGQPATTETTKRFGPNVVEGSRYLEDNEIDSLILTSVRFGFAAVAAIWIIQFIIQIMILFFVFAQNLYLGIIIITVVVAIATMMVWGAMRDIRQGIDTYRNFHKAREGEDAVTEKLRASLDNQWFIFRNIQLPDRQDDIDIVLVGPQGVWVLEVKAYSGTLRFKNGKWEMQIKNGWKKVDRDPSMQARRNAQRLNGFLQREAISIRWIEAVVALTEPHPITNFENSETPIWLLPQVEDKVKNLTTRTPPNAKEVEQITTALTKLAEKQIAVEESKNR